MHDFGINYVILLIGHQFLSTATKQVLNKLLKCYLSLQGTCIRMSLMACELLYP